MMLKAPPSSFAYGVGSLASRMRSGFLTALDFALPPRCPTSGAVVARPGGLAPSAWKAMNFLAGPACASCAFPFETVTPEGTLCGACDRNPPSFDRLRAALGYDDASKDLILQFKHGDRLDLAPMIAHWLWRASGPLLDEADFLVAVPLHRTRLWKRQYNQAAVLASALGDLSGVPDKPTLLRRLRPTPPQGALSPIARSRNVKGAFRVSDREAPLVKGAHIVLVDDVFTTGATIEECARVLKHAGANRVDAVCAARVLQARR